MKTNIITKIIYLNHRLSVRGIGHTYCLIHGAKDSANAIILVSSMAEIQEMKKECPQAKVMSTNDPSMIDKIMSTRGPVLIDNHALTSLFSEVILEYSMLSEENESLKLELDSLKRKYNDSGDV